jgi:hypothetical protein
MFPNGIALKLLTSSNESPLEIANAHLAHARTHDGKVLYSTNIPISSRFTNLKSAILYFEKSPQQFIFIQADILSISCGNKFKYIPSIANEFSPPQYADQPRQTWLLFTNLRRADMEFLRSLKSVRTDGVLVPFTQIVSDSPRANRVYWYIDPENDDDGLIF